MQKAYAKACAKGHQVATLGSLEISDKEKKTVVEILTTISEFAQLKIDSTDLVYLNAGTHLTPQSAGTVLEILNNPLLSSVEPSQQAQQILYNRFIGEKNLLSQTVSFRFNQQA